MKSILLLLTALVFMIGCQAAGGKAGAGEERKMTADNNSKKSKEPETVITKAEAMQIADNYLKLQKLNWGKPVLAVIVEAGSRVLVEDINKKKHEEMWPSVYFVQYETSKKEKELEGIRTVIVTKDGRKVTIPPSE